MNESLEARVARLERAAGGYDDPRIQAEIERLDAEIQAIIEKNAAAHGLSVDEYLAAHPLDGAPHVCAADPEPPRRNDVNIQAPKKDAADDWNIPTPKKDVPEPPREPRPARLVSLLRDESSQVWRRLDW